jgi:hypothetical protein
MLSIITLPLNSFIICALILDLIYMGRLFAVPKVPPLLLLQRRHAALHN